ncbi:MAG: amidohydrolase family protein [Rhodospirillales bacterium]|nr:amidohydrolase family protein [Rhodospirillales bacterium]
MAEVLFKNFELLDVHEGVLKSGHQLLVKDDRIAAVKKGAIRAPKAETVDCGARTLMPGLIDCHLHIHNRGRLGPAAYPQALPSLQTATAGDVLKGVLMRGFTTGRDTGGADLGHKQAVEQGLFIGPRLFVSGKSLTMTGGHGDGRSRFDLCEPCACVHLSGGGRIADGVDEVRKAVRDEIRLGADAIKFSASGGIASAADTIGHIQYSMEEIEAAVDEATRSDTYVLAHVYSDVAIRRCVEAGVHSIEHGNFLSPETAALMAEKGAVLVPTLVTFRALAERGAAMQISEFEMSKIHYVLSSGTRSLEVAKAAGVKMAYGTDCFRSGEEYESQEFLVRADVLSAAEIIHSATVVGAELVRMAGEIGVIAPGAYADILVVDGNPLDDLGLFQDEGAHMSAIMKEGRFYKNRLASAGLKASAKRALETV